MYVSRCPVCRKPFSSKRRRTWCSQRCYYQARGKTPYVPEESERRSADPDWLHEQIAKWYVQKAAERLAMGVKQPIPLPTVLSCHDQGIAAYAPGRLVRIAATVEDEPGPQEERSENYHS